MSTPTAAPAAPKKPRRGPVGLVAWSDPAAVAAHDKRKAARAARIRERLPAPVKTPFQQQAAEQFATLKGGAKAAPSPKPPARPAPPAGPKLYHTDHRTGTMAPRPPELLTRAQAQELAKMSYAEFGRAVAAGRLPGRDTSVQNRAVWNRKALLKALRTSR